MSVNLSYPGLYIQELPLSTHAITPAPTSIAAFVGYTHPWKTKAQFGAARRLYSFTDYETWFGGLYASGDISSDVAHAVYEFFLNGGTDAYVVGLQPKAYDSSNNALATYGDPLVGGIAPTATITQMNPNSTYGMKVTALEPVDQVPMTVKITNIRSAVPTVPPSGVYDTFDLVVTYGSRVETFRNLGIGFSTGTAPDVAINDVSTLITVQKLAAGYGSSFTGGTPASPPPTIVVNPSLTNPPGFATSFSASDFIPPFEANSALDQVEIFNLLLIPGIADNLIVSAALSFAERKRAFAILDPAAQATAVGPNSIDKLTLPESQNGAIYFPYLRATDFVTTKPIDLPPSGYVAGVYAATDNTRGVWKAPAGIGTPLKDTIGPVASGLMNDMQQGALNLASINCLRSFNNLGTVVFGARTLVAANTAFAQSMYVPVRRMTLFIEQTLLANLKWVVFEPNDEPLWIAIRTSIESFLLSLFNQQALQGPTPSAAFQVKCDSSTTTSDDQAKGVVNIVVGVALLKPAEFVVIKITQLAGQTS